jgi:putative flippase GtrA
MSDLQRRPGSGLSRSARERRGFQLIVAGGTAGAVAVVTFVLALAGVLSWGVPFLALAIAIVCGLLFRRIVAR